MNRLKIFVLSHKKYFIFSLLLIPFIVCLALVSSTIYNIARANFGSWGDSSLIHACKDTRGRVTLVSTSDSCNTGETQVTWLKDVDAGNGLTISRSSSGATLSLANSDGWTASSDTWTYASATSFTISGVDKTSVYTPGTKLKFTNNSSTKYGYVKSSSFSTNTTVNLVSNTDYSLNNSSITNPYYSYASNPPGHPGFLNLDTSNITGFSSITGYTFKMAVEGKSVHIDMTIQGTSNATTFTFPAPISAPSSYFNVSPIVVEDNSSIQNSPGVIGFSTVDVTTIHVGKTISSLAGNGFGGFTSSGGKGARGSFFYPID